MKNFVVSHEDFCCLDHWTTNSKQNLRTPCLLWSLKGTTATRKQNCTGECRQSIRATVAQIRLRRLPKLIASCVVWFWGQFGNFRACLRQTKNVVSQQVFCKQTTWPWTKCSNYLLQLPSKLLVEVVGLRQETDWVRDVSYCFASHSLFRLSHC